MYTNIKKKKKNTHKLTQFHPGLFRRWKMCPRASYTG